MNLVEQAQFNYGVKQFNDSDFFDCHDTLERIWMENNGEERRFLQGLIQVAVAYYHQGNGNFKGAESQLSKAIAKLEAYPDLYYGIDLQALLTTIRLHQAIFNNANLRKYNLHSAKEVSAPFIRVQTHT